MGDYIIGILMGILVGLFIGSAIFTFTENNYSVGNALVAECELTIPRDQHCIITAVIEEKE